MPKQRAAEKQRNPHQRHNPRRLTPMSRRQSQLEPNHANRHNLIDQHLISALDAQTLGLRAMRPVQLNRSTAPAGQLERWMKLDF